MPEQQKTKKSNSLQVYITLLGYVKPYISLFALSLVGYILFALSQPAVAKLLEYFVELLDGTSDIAIYWVPIAMLLLAFARGIGSFVGNYYLARVSMQVVHDLRCKMFYHMIVLPNSYYDNHNSGHLIARITYNVSMVTSAASDAIKVAIREGLTVIFTLGYLFYTSWKLTLIFIAITPLIAVVVGSASKRFRSLSTKVQFSMGDLTHVTSETINGYREVRSFGGEEYERARFTDASTQNTNQNMKMTRASAVHTPTLQFLVSCALAVLLYVILWMRGDATTAALIGFITAAFLLPKPIRQLSEINSDIQKGIAAAENIFEMLDEVPEQDTGTFSKKRINGKIEFRNINFQYPNTDHWSLKYISFTVEPGHTVALVGKSGSGKTTLASLVVRFYNHDKGDILIDDIPLKDYALKNLRSHIALVNQNVTLFNDTVARNIAYGSLREAKDEDIQIAAEAAHATEFIQNMPKGMDTLIGENGVLLSGGQRQRISIARAILKDAPILILDEATSALDTESERHIQAALDEVMKNRTTLVIAHRLSTIENADKIIVMDRGCIVETGNHTELLAQNGYYAKLHKMQFQNVETSDEDITLESINSVELK
ncbi:MAG: lipid A export permease/ATP-binding protein MsbA [Candidatus Endonucleobacter bathymodioli]|uniref:Lipid A export permease/ATP-binding protein MsbA n=1 Tax=Candidatus Endonucleibacter bathymodioli TaxID=539814 RepID=A0AA90SMQ5_9GAMM|nr:lipid A export permease/ATP-binding protein MsbA [Candidatus Endonucleobacter bathymodioli]